MAQFDRISTGSILSAIALLFGAIWVKNYGEEQIFYKTQYQHPLVTRYNGLNVIQLINKAWWGQPQDITLNFNVKTKLKNLIYVRGISDAATQGLFRDEQFKEDPNCLPNVSIFPSSSGLNNIKVIDQGDGSFRVTVIGKLPADNSDSVAILWLNNIEDKTIVPELLLLGSKPCGSYDSRSFITKYHIVPVCLGGIACVLAGVAITRYFPKYVTIGDFNAQEVSKIEMLNKLLNETKKLIQQNKKQRGNKQ